jgi:hypothetical protein
MTWDSRVSAVTLVPTEDQRFLMPCGPGAASAATP